MIVRPFQISDYPEVCEWWRARQWKNIPLSILSSIGLVVEEDGIKYCAGWLYVSNSTLTWLEWIVTNPGSPMRRRREALDLLIEDAKTKLKALGGETVYVQLKSKSLMRVYEAHGFTKGDTGMDHYILRLE